MKRSAFAWGGYLVAVHLALIAAGVLAWKVYVEEKPVWPLMRAMHAQMDPQVPAGATLFLGDSITQALATAAVAPVSVNYGISGQRSGQLLESMDTYQSMGRAAAIVVMVGTNDVREGLEEGIGKRYRAILAKVPAGVPVVLASAPPQRDLDARPAAEAARRACAADQRCRFVDAFAVLSQPGTLGDDGIHLTDKGYRVLAEALRQAITRQAPA